MITAQESPYFPTVPTNFEDLGLAFFSNLKRVIFEFSEKIALKRDELSKDPRLKFFPPETGYCKTLRNELLIRLPDWKEVSIKVFKETFIKLINEGFMTKTRQWMLTKFKLLEGMKVKFLKFLGTIFYSQVRLTVS